jgi:hypothetical protein
MACDVRYRVLTRDIRLLRLVIVNGSSRRMNFMFWITTGEGDLKVVVNN